MFFFVEMWTDFAEETEGYNINVLCAEACDSDKTRPIL